eukprot:3381567-Prymnesium_polylepis.1
MPCTQAGWTPGGVEEPPNQVRQVVSINKRARCLRGSSIERKATDHVSFPHRPADVVIPEARPPCK